MLANRFAQLLNDSHQTPGTFPPSRAFDRSLRQQFPDAKHYGDDRRAPFGVPTSRLEIVITDLITIAIDQASKPILAAANLFITLLPKDVNGCIKPQVFGTCA